MPQRRTDALFSRLSRPGEHLAPQPPRLRQTTGASHPRSMLAVATALRRGQQRPSERSWARAVRLASASAEEAAADAAQLAGRCGVRTRRCVGTARWAAFTLCGEELVGRCGRRCPTSSWSRTRRSGKTCTRRRDSARSWSSAASISAVRTAASVWSMWIEWRLRPLRTRAFRSRAPVGSPVFVAAFCTWKRCFRIHV